MKSVRRFLAVIVSLTSLLGSCYYNTSKDTTLLFSHVYSIKKGKPINPFEYQVKKIAGKQYDSISIYHNSTLLGTYKQKEVKSRGLLNICNGKYIITHTFNNRSNSFKYCLSLPPFMNTHISLIGSKIYIVSGRRYRIYHYREFNDVDQDSYDNYFLEDVGYVCYFNFEKDEYLVCDSTNLNNLPIKKITHSLVNDSMFFAKYTNAKLMPNFYRIK
jgi:hypothetical protein